MYIDIVIVNSNSNNSNSNSNSNGRSAEVISKEIPVPASAIEKFPDPRAAR